ncbi:g10848 [Coccomyxa elongata]
MADLPASQGDALEELHDRYLSLRYDDGITDTADFGYNFNTTVWRPTLWTAAFSACVALEPTLPDEEGTVGVEEVELDDVQGSSRVRQTRAVQGTRELVRGSMASLPFTPGGEALQVTTTAASRAAEEAATGKWLEEFESGRPLRALAPGMDQGVFGAWGVPDEVSGGAVPVPETQEEKVTVVEEQRSASQNEAPGVSQPLDLTNLFAGILMDDEPEAMEEELAAVEEVSSAKAEERPKATILSRLQELPSDNDISGAVGPSANGTARLDLGNGVHASVDTSLPLGQRFVPPSPATTSGREPQGRQHTTAWAVRGGIKDLAGEFERLRPSMAHHFPFELDTFQKEAVVHLEKGHSVFVAAHTSAGKTAVAEYALALAAKHCTRAIYTSPIKTISNQKFRDFSSDFEVGLLTGDVSIKPESPCLIMTTEILRSMLYKGADIIRDIEWVIFDEVHYVNDAERGVVWEEVIIMLPAHVNLILLSATVPNVMEFADWVGRTKRKRIYVTGTTKRPVPLEHNLYYNGALYTICRADNFLPEGVAAARSAWKKRNAKPETKKDEKRARPTGRGDGGGPAQRGGRQSSGSGGRGGRGGSQAGHIASQLQQGRGGGANSNSGLRSEKSAWLALIDDLRKKALLPVVVFCFSKKRVDLLADNLSNVDLATAADKSEIHVFCERALARLRGPDRELPQILRVREMLKRGLGVHHAGLLPIVKEVVEMLFCRGLVKVLFCTETFAMGVNAPARTVIFQSLRKHDGKDFRNLLPGEYTQMAGRAGRRGLDPVGTVIIACWDDVYEEGELKKLLTGRATKLESQFRLTYSMILNLLRVEDLKVEDMLKRSFAEFHAQRAAPEALEGLRAGQQRLAALRARPWPSSFLGTSREAVERYFALSQRIKALSVELQESVMGSRNAMQALVPGRVVLVTNSSSGLPELGAICGAPAAASKGIQLGSAASSGPQGKPYYVVTLHTASPMDDLEQQQAASTSKPGSARAPDAFQVPSGFVLKGAINRGGPIGPGPLPRRGDLGDVKYILQEVDVSRIEAICKAKVKVNPDSVLDPEAPQGLAHVVRQLQQLQEEAEAQAEGHPPLLDPVTDLKLNQLDIVEAVRERQALLQVRAALACHRDPGLGEMYAIVRSEALLASRLAALTHQVSDASLAQMPEFRQRVDVLRRMQYLAEDDTVQLKGRVACEINSGDELVATEMIFAGVLTELTPEEAVALLSALVFQEKSDVEAPAPTDALADACDHAVALAWEAGQVQKECGMDILPDEYARGALKFGLVEVVYQWARGVPFKEICTLTDVMEGSIVRAIVRLDETCREVKDAAKVMGNTALVQQMEAASAAIKRDVIFAVSLYVA